MWIFSTVHGLQDQKWWTSSSNSIAHEMCTSTRISIASTARTWVGIRPGKGDCTAAAKSSELALVTVLSTRLHFPFHRLWAFSNALDKCFLHFRQVHWCLVSALACKNAWPHGHTHSEDLEAKASLSPNWGWCSIMTIRSLWMALGGGLREEVQLAFKLKVSY